MKIPETFVTIDSEDVGLTNLGSLRLYMRWRAGRRQAGTTALQQWNDGGYRLPVKTIGVVPERVLLWDEPRQGERRPNSLKRFGYMLGLRAVPLALMGGTEALSKYLEDVTQFDQLGYDESRQQAGAMLHEWFESDANDRPGHLHRANTRLTFGYFPPEDKFSLLALQGQLSTLENGQ